MKRILNVKRLAVLLAVSGCLFAADPTFLRRQVSDVTPRPDDLTAAGAHGASYKPLFGIGDQDVDQLKAELEKQRYLVIPLKDGDATKQTVLNAIEQSGEAAQRSGGTMIFSFSGHGFADGGANYLALHDAAANRLAYAAHQTSGRWRHWSGRWSRPRERMWPQMWPWT